MQHSKKQIRIAIVGPGKIAQDQHIPAIAASPDFKIVATVSDVAGPEQWPSYRTVSELIANGPEVDAVAICTPPQVRGRIATEAINAGLDVLLEKPPAMTPGEFAGICHLAQTKGVVLFAAWHSRFAPKVEQARDLVRMRGLASGKIVWREDVHQWHPGQTWLWEPGGLGVFDPCINALSILTYIHAEPFYVRSAEFDVPENCHAPIAARLKLQAGEVGVEVDTDFRQTGKQSWDIELSCQDGTRIVLGEGGSTLTIDGGSPLRDDEAEYPKIYEKFGNLIKASSSETDCAPLQLVADAFLVANFNRTEKFIY